MAIGKVLWFNDLKGYGFVEDESGTQYLLRQEAIKQQGKKSLTPGKKVKFSIEKDPVEITDREVRLIKNLEII